MSDLLALVLELRPEGGQRPSYLGRAAQAWFLAELGRHDRALTAALHEGADVRPYTLWPGWGTTPFLRVTSVAPALSAFLLERWLPGLPTWIRLGDVSFEIAGIATQSEGHPWAGQACYAELVQGQGDRGAGERGVTFEFATPTLFRSNNLDVPLPLPGLIFDGLMQKWERFAPVSLDGGLKGWIETHLAVNRYDLKTRLVRFGGDRRDAMGGFMGHCRLAFVGTEGAAVQVAQCRALAEFAFYAGVGRRTTMGLGQCKVQGSRGEGSGGGAGDERAEADSEPSGVGGVSDGNGGGDADF